jgi:integral membrane sensor domain MASE1
LLGNCGACITAFLGALFLAADHLIPAHGYLPATMNWWVGDAVAIGSIVPFFLIYILPGLRRFAGYSESDGTPDLAVLPVNAINFAAFRARSNPGCSPRAW